jgi:hypothetical protein
VSNANLRSLCDFFLDQFEAGNVRGFAEAGFGDAGARGVIEENSILMAEPNGVRSQQPGAFDLQEQTARLAATNNHALKKVGRET